MNNRSLLRWSTLFFFFSGATGLIYQVLWTRRLTLVFGHTVLAVSTVLTAFMAGLALGSVLAGQWTDRPTKNRPTSRFLADYGYLEGFVGVWAVLTLPLLNLVERLYVQLASTGLTGASLQLACFLAAACVLVPPTTAMGATVPLLSRLLVQQQGEVGPILSRLYGLNTMGALLGAFLGGFVLLPTLGLRLSTLLAAAVNLAIAAGAVSKASQLQSQPPEEPETSSTSQGSGWIPLSFALAGAASMGYQVAWNRSLCLAIGSSIYAFSTILVLFLAGLGLGSLIYPRLMRNRTPGLNQLAWLYLAIALSGAFTVVIIPWLPKAFFQLFPYAGQRFRGVLLIDFLLVGILLLPPTLCMGVGFPLATAVYSRSLAGLGRSVGNVYGANTLGCILGAFLTGFVAVPYLGAQSTLQLACLLYLGNAIALFTIEKRPLPALACLLSAALTMLLPRWQTAVLTSGMAIYSGNRAYVLNQPPAVYLDGMSSAVSLHLDGENWDIPSMRVNGKVDASRSKGDRLTQYLLGYLPVLLHPAPAHVGIIGLGGGFTVEAVARCPGVKSIEVAELEPAVVQIGEYWKPFNSRVLEDGRVQMHINDGRTLVLASAQPFDVLISEPSNPWIAGIGSLFTRDFYQVARDRLSANGIMCQWFNLYAVSQADMKMVIRSFYDVFPHGHLWQSSGGDLILLGSSQPIPFDLERIRQAWQTSPKIQDHFFEIGIHHPDILAGHFLMTREKALQLAQIGPFNSDDCPLLEFSAPFSLYRPQEAESNRQALFQFAPFDLPPGLTADQTLRRRALFGALNRLNYPQLWATVPHYQAEDPEVFLLGAALKLSLGEKGLQGARELYATCLQAFPGAPSALAAARWADLEYEHQQPAKAAELYELALKQPPPGSGAYLWQMLGQSYLKLGDRSRAVPALLKSAELSPHASIALALAGAALDELKDDKTSDKVLQQALQRNPYDPLALKSMAAVKQHQGDFQAEEQLLTRFLALCPDYPDIWIRMASCRMAQGNRDGARAALQQALKLVPGDAALLSALQSL